VTAQGLKDIDGEAALRALVVLRAADRAEREPEPRISTELLLHKAGFSNAQIGDIVGEKSDTVRKRLERAGKAESKPSAKVKKK
jgi:DNA-directed RNA polymerase specialized sigma24 family protein